MGIPIARDHQSHKGDDDKVLSKGGNGHPLIFGDRPKEGGNMPKIWHGDKEDKVKIVNENCSDAK